MRILIDARLYGLENAGIGRYIKNLTRQLVHDHKNEYIIILNKKYFNLLNLPDNFHKVSSDVKHYTFTEQVKILSLINKLRPDLVHFPHFNSPLVYRGKYIVTIHDLLWHKQRGFSVTTQPKLIYLFKYLGYRAVFDNAVKNSVGIIVPSNTVKKDLLSLYPIPTEKVRVIYEGVDEDIKSNQNRKQKDVIEKYFLYVGSLYPHKNVQLLVKSLDELNQHLRLNIKLKVVSARNAFLDKFKSFLKVNNLRGNVDIYHEVNDEKLFSLYSNSLATVFPSISEGFGLGGIEAMRAKTLVVCSDIPIFREIYSRNALYFDVNDGESLKKILGKVYNFKSNERANLIKKSYEYSLKFSWEKFGKEIVDFYQTV